MKELRCVLNDASQFFFGVGEWILSESGLSGLWIGFHHGKSSWTGSVRYTDISIPVIATRLLVSINHNFQFLSEIEDSA